MPWWWYLLAVGVAVLLGAEVHMGNPGLRSWIGYAITVPLLVATLAWLGRIRVRVVDGELHVGEATLPLRQIGRIERRPTGPPLIPGDCESVVKKTDTRG